MSQESGALQGVKVLDVGQLVQGPQAAAMLCDMGAEVTKVELPGVGDLSRWIFLSEDDPRSGYFEACNRGKKSITLDLRRAAGADVFRTLAKEADVVMSNFKSGTMEDWGLGYEALRDLNPGLIWAAGSAFGHLGDDAQREGADLAGQCAGGLISTIGQDGTPASPVGVTIADHVASQNLTSGILAALYSRSQTGLGQRVEVSLLGGQIWAQASEYSHFLMSGEQPGRANSGHPLLRGVYGIFETQDGYVGIIGVPPDVRDAFFIAVEQPELASDPRFQGLLASREDMKYLFETLTPAFKQKTTDEWCGVLREMGVRYAPVRSYQQACEDPGLVQNGYLIEDQDEHGAMRKRVGAPIHMSGTPLTPAPVAPTLGEHTEQILKGAGYNDNDIARLQTQGVI